MNNETRKLIFDLAKTKHFGLELEMTGITRQRAAQVTADYFGGTWRHVGGGYDKYVATDRAGREYAFVTDSSICSNRLYQCEMNTPPLLYNDIEDLQGLVRALRAAGAVSAPSYSNQEGGCGIHVHVEASGHDSRTLRNLINFVNANYDLFGAAAATDRVRLYKWCRRHNPDFIAAINALKTGKEAGENALTIDNLRSLHYGHTDHTSACGWSAGTDSHVRYEVSQHYSNYRYTFINLHRYFMTEGTAANTVEFRAFDGTMHAGKIRAYILFALCVNSKALVSTYIRPVESRTALNNKKYAFRNVLNSIGWIGDEFENPRKLLLQNLEGRSWLV